MFQPSIKSSKSCEVHGGYRCEVSKTSTMAVSSPNSMRKIFHPELESIEFDDVKLQGESIRVKYAPQEMINGANVTRLAVSLNIDLEPEAYQFLDYLEDRTYTDDYMSTEKESKLEFCSSFFLPHSASRQQVGKYCA